MKTINKKLFNKCKILSPSSNKKNLDYRHNKLIQLRILYIILKNEIMIEFKIVFKMRCCQPNILTAGPMEVLICKVLTLFHPFLSKEIKKLIDMLMFYLICSSVISAVATAVPRQRTL